MKRAQRPAKNPRLKHILNVAKSLGIPEKYLELYGHYKAKVSPDILDAIGRRKSGKYIDVTGMTPTPLGEGKTVTTIGLSMALNRLGSKAVACIRQPSLGPVFGIKGGGSGGGASQVLPSYDANIHLTGDNHAVETAHNLCAAFLDNHLYRGNALDIDLEKIFWHRVFDVNDRALRAIRIGVGGGEAGIERHTRFEIAVASELMAILALADSMPDLKKRISRIVVALTRGRKPVTCADLKVAGAMAVLLKDAIKPNLLQTSENTPCFVHTGPFANIAHGNSSVLADKIALKLADFVVTESGFGADCGAEKFFDIKCRYSGLKPDVVVLVCSVRALKAHSGRYKIAPGRPLDKGLCKENLDAVEEGCANLEKQIENVNMFGVPCIVAVNRFRTDTARELDIIRKRSLRDGAFDCVVSDLYSRGSAGGEELAKAVAIASQHKSRFKFLYPLNASIKEKIETIATRIYGASGVRYERLAEEDIALYEKLGFGKLPVCIAKTHLSLSHDPRLKGRPQGFELPVRDVRPSTGAGFLYALCGTMMTMPSLPSHPIGERFDIDARGNVKGL